MRSFFVVLAKHIGFIVRAFLFLVFCSSHYNTLNAQSCQSSLFAKYHSFPGFGYGPYADTIPGGGFILGNVRNYKKALIKTDEEGNFLWAKSYDFVGSAVYTDKGGGKVDKNGNYIIDVNGNALALTDPQGNVITMKSLNIRNPNNVVILSIYVLPDNKKLVFMKDDSFYGGDAYALVCLSPDISTIVWTRYLSGGSLFLTTPNFIDNKLYFGGANGDYGLFICIDAITGAVINQVRYQVGNSGTRVLRIYPYENGYLATAQYNTPLVWPYNHAVLRLDNNLNIIRAYGFSNIFDNQALILLPETDGSYFGCNSGGGVRFNVSAADDILFTRMTVAGFLYAPFALYNYRGGLLSVSNGNWNNVGVGIESSLGLIKTDENGSFPCFASPTPLTRNFVTGAKSNFSLYIRDTSFITLQNETPIVNTLLYNSSSNCNMVNPCSTLELEGQTDICGTGSFTYIGKRNSGCALPLTWELTGGNATKSKLNDSTLTINFSQPGNYRLIGTLGGSCATIADTLIINVSGNSQVLDIGPADSSLCAGNTIYLDAGQGFSSYTWQDGSANATYNVTTPGKYYVTVISVCGNTYSDTITIHPAPPVDVSIGPDRIKCNNDTVRLTAPAGFLNYLWGNNYNINAVTGQSVIVNPTLDTAYHVRVEKTPGCFGYDTVRIKVNYSPPIYLGRDTSFCSNQSVTLNAGAGFNSYKWSNGSIANQVTVNVAGYYSVIGTTVQGCNSYDTLQIITVYQLPVVSLDKNSGLCKDENRVLNAGQYKNYLWQNGSTQSTFTASTTGKYYVQVTDINGCAGSDTTLINVINELPKDFLATTLEICNYGTHPLQPTANYKTYLWNTGSRSTNISVTEGGTYWLRVTDQNNCTGSDTILVTKKQCLTGLYVPTAFTPDGNGKNDNFKALLFGDIESFDFKIFNRYGQVVFATSNQSKGWDGKLSGLQQNAGVFVWTCSYKLKGQPHTLEKGTVVLIR